MKTAYNFPTYVECPECHSKFDEAEIKILSASWRGVVVFKCPKCGKVVESHRYE